MIGLNPFSWSFPEILFYISYNLSEIISFIASSLELILVDHLLLYSIKAILLASIFTADKFWLTGSKNFLYSDCFYSSSYKIRCLGNYLWRVVSKYTKILQ